MRSAHTHTYTHAWTVLHIQAGRADWGIFVTEEKMPLNYTHTHTTRTVFFFIPSWMIRFVILLFLSSLRIASLTPLTFKPTLSNDLTAAAAVTEAE